ncbi:ubiquitin carboxyl-terminal hydrolase/EEP domain-containing protein [Tetraselmis virus 1]|uniref:ubiquitinyl hydrolase 1 n=1 Tax=Tetraselmis virus 1 TaxID=2060617 RepID=A0A2P0VNL0_9VIRU|nr:ubiquitin carboxyl-terminal hydrolase/EEP domain-containing protein [Tetraselmis virus 1]AUF82450.1 ubiquitin carboxyl-terminal hydrolase/EEP domain-containing protein [Tetraselmis virus 1]
MDTLVTAVVTSIVGVASENLKNDYGKNGSSKNVTNRSPNTSTSTSLSDSLNDLNYQSNRYHQPEVDEKEIDVSKNDPSVYDDLRKAVTYDTDSTSHAHVHVKDTEQIKTVSNTVSKQTVDKSLSTTKKHTFETIEKHNDKSTIDIFSYNVMWESMNKIEALGTKKRESRRKCIKTAVSKASGARADIIGLQELPNNNDDKTQYNFENIYKSLLGKHYHVYRHESSNDGILTAVSKTYNVLRYDKGAFASGRPWQGFYLENKTTKDKLRVFNVHMPHILKSSDLQTETENYIKSLTNLFDKKTPVIIFGDMNRNPSKLFFENNMKVSGFTDPTCCLSIQGKGVYNRKYDNVISSFPTETAEVGAKIHFLADFEKDLKCSDHLPIYARLSLPENPPKAKAEDKAPEKPPKARAEDKAPEKPPKAKAEDKAPEKPPKAKAEDKAPEKPPKAKAEDSADITWKDVDVPDLPLLKRAFNHDTSKRYYFQSVFDGKMESPMVYEFLPAGNKKPPDANKDWINKSKNTVNVFHSTGSSKALLIVPKSGKNLDFNQYIQSSDVSDDEKVAFLATVFEYASQARAISKSPVYVTTDGRAINWLHIRIETKPPYLKRSGIFKNVPSFEQSNTTCPVLVLGSESTSSSTESCKVVHVSNFEDLTLSDDMSIHVDYFSTSSYHQLEELRFIFMNTKNFSKIVFTPDYFTMASHEIKRRKLNDGNIKFLVSDFINSVKADEYIIQGFSEPLEINSFDPSFQEVNNVITIKRDREYDQYLYEALYKLPQPIALTTREGIYNIGNSCYINSAIQMYRKYIDYTKQTPLDKFKYFIDTQYTKLRPEYDILNKLFGFQRFQDSSENVIGDIGLTIVSSLPTNANTVSESVNDSGSLSSIKKEKGFVYSVSPHVMMLDDTSIDSKYEPIEYTYRGQKYAFLKNPDKQIEWSVTIEGDRYSLQSIVLHTGSHIGFGHYINMTKWNDEWILYNDDTVTIVDKNKISDFVNVNDPNFKTATLFLYVLDETPISGGSILSYVDINRLFTNITVYGLRSVWTFKRNDLPMDLAATVVLYGISHGVGLMSSEDAEIAIYTTFLSICTLYISNSVLKDKINLKRIVNQIILGFFLLLTTYLSSRV